MCELHDVKSPFWRVIYSNKLRWSEWKFVTYILIESHLAFDLRYNIDIWEHTDRQTSPDLFSFFARAVLSVCVLLNVDSISQIEGHMAFCQNLD